MTYPCRRLASSCTHSNALTYRRARCRAEIRQPGPSAAVRAVHLVSVWHRPKPATRGVDCDEYPFYSTVEGGPGASLKEVPSNENRAEGNALNSMYQDADCQFVSGQTKFFVVPVAVPITVPEPDPNIGAATTTTYAGPPSGHVCTPPAPVQAT
jgi:Deoxyribonuclease NucA/NucB